MDKIARYSEQDRADLFNEVSNRRGDMSPILVEKDFWVCWTLRKIFSMKKFSEQLVFKGGTSLSKVYDVIERFSEDIDLSFDRRIFGLKGSNDLTNELSRKQKDKRIKALRKDCINKIHNEFLPDMREAILESLKIGLSEDTWSLEISDLDQATLMFRYPKSRIASGKEPYVHPLIKLEMGARGERWPQHSGTVTSYAAAEFPELFDDPVCTVNVLAAERTFWEKVTILHAHAQQFESKGFKTHQSRHYYDVFKLYHNSIGDKAIKDLKLLGEVVEHNRIFFQDKPLKFDEPVPGSLKLVPPDLLKKELIKDYAEMKDEMIFGEAPSMDQIFQVLSDIENKVNGSV